MKRSDQRTEFNSTLVIEVLEKLEPSIDRNCLRDAMEEDFHTKYPKDVSEYPSMGTLNKALQTGKASPRFKKILAPALITVIHKAVMGGECTYHDLPDLKSLGIELPVSSNNNVLQTFTQIKGDECYAEIEDMIMNSDKDHVLYASIRTGKRLRNLLERVLSDNKKPQINRINIQRLSQFVIKSLLELDLLEAGFDFFLKSNLDRISDIWHPERRGIVFETTSIYHWNGMPFFHGIMYGDVMYYGRWHFIEEKLITNEETMYKLDSRDSRFMFYKRMFQSDFISEHHADYINRVISPYIR